MYPNPLKLFLSLLCALLVPLAIGAGVQQVTIDANGNVLNTVLTNYPAGGLQINGVAVDTSLANRQPLDSDLTAIAALVTDPFGRVLLTKGDAAAVRTYISAGTSNFDGAFSSLTGKPTTIAGYGITDFNSLGNAQWSLLSHVHAAADITSGTLAIARIPTGATSSTVATGDKGVTTLTLNTPSLIYTTPVTFTNTAGAWAATLALATQTQKTFLAGPASGAVATPTFRTIAAADIGTGTANTTTFLRGDQTWTAVTVPTIPSTANMLKGDGAGNATSAGFTMPSSFAIGDLIYANASGALVSLADVATGSVLLSGGVTTAPSYGKVTTSHTTGIAASGSNGDITATAALNTLTAASATNLVLNAGSSGGQITLGQGANGSITLAPSGTGKVITAAIQGTGVTSTTPLLNLRTDVVRLEVARASDGAVSAGQVYTGRFGVYNGSFDVAYLNSTGLQLTTTTPSITWSSTANNPTNTLDLGVTRNAAGVAEINTGTAGQWASLKLGTRNATTNTVTDGLIIGHQLSTGTAATGLGEGILFNLDSSTTADQNAMRLRTEWTTATHASRTAKFVLALENNAGASLTDVLAVNGSGNIVLSTAISARAYNSGFQTLTTSTDTTLLFDSERWDTDTIHSTTTNTGRLTCNTAGIYTIAANVSFANNATGLRLVKIVLNGATVICLDMRAALSGSDTHMALSTQYNLAAGDYVECVAWQSSGGNLNTVVTGNASSEFSMVRVP